MNGWLTQLLGEQTATYTLYLLGAIVVGVLIWVIWFWTRRVAGGVFVEGGRNRRHRLAVVDATAVDSHRRIVLVRRDDVEHLVMIGGQNDFVIERNIARASIDAPQRAPVKERRPREAPGTGRRQQPKEAPPARPAARETEPRPAPPAPPAAPVVPAQPVREAAAAEPPSTAAAVAAAVAVTSAYLRHEPDQAPAPIAPVQESPAEPTSSFLADALRTGRNTESRNDEPPIIEKSRLEAIAASDEPLLRAPEPVQRAAEAITPPDTTEEIPAAAPTEPAPETEKTEAAEAMELREIAAEVAPQELAPDVVAPEPESRPSFMDRFGRTETEEAPAAPRESDAEQETEKPEAPVIAIAIPEAPVDSSSDSATETGPEAQVELASATIAESAPEKPATEDEPEPRSESLEDEMHRLLAQLTGKN